jgi:hypothetical protein
LLAAAARHRASSGGGSGGSARSGGGPEPRGFGSRSNASTTRTTTTTEPQEARWRQVPRQQAAEQKATAADDDATNPLELLRTARDPPRRAALMQRATGTGGGWRAWSERYRPLAVERLLADELAGVDRTQAMLLAVGNPTLAEAFPELAAEAAGEEEEEKEDAAASATSLAPARRALRALRGAGLSDAECWAAVSRRPGLLLRHPPALQRWLDLLALYEARPADVANFLARAPEALLREDDDEEEVDEADVDDSSSSGGKRQQQQKNKKRQRSTDQQPTFAEAQAVARYLTTELRMPRPELAARVLAARPGVLARDVTRDLAPLQQFAARELGLGAEAWGRAALACPELLSDATVTRHLRPFVDFCTRELGATPEQAGSLLMAAPRLPLGKPPSAEAVLGVGGVAPLWHSSSISAADSDGSLDPAEAALAPRLEQLERLAGVERGSEPMRQMTAAAAAGGAAGGLDWLAVPEAPGAQLRALARVLGAEREDLGRLAVACPALLSQRPGELLRRGAWLRAVAAGGDAEAAAAATPTATAAALRLALAHPHVLVVPLRQYAAPRLAFGRATVEGDAAALSPAAARAAGRDAACAALEGEEEEEEQEGKEEAASAAASSSDSSSSLPLPDLTALVAPGADDEAWVQGLLRLAPAPPSAAAPGLSLPSSSSLASLAPSAAWSQLGAAYTAYRAEFDRGYADQLREASTAELRKLGIMEGGGSVAAAAAGAAAR